MLDGTTNTSKNPAIKKSSDGERSSFPLSPAPSQVLPPIGCKLFLVRTTHWALEHARVEELAKKRDVSMAQIGLAWTLTKEGSLEFPFLSGIRVHTLTYFCFCNTVVAAPIIGTTSLDKLKDLISKTVCFVHLRVQ
jgi:hypothetical protein